MFDRYIRFNCLFALMLCSALAFGQNLTGHWSGEIPQNNKDIKYVLEADITQTGNKLNGTTKSTIVNRAAWVVVTFRGTISGNTVTLTEYKGVSCNCANGQTYCLKKMLGKLTLDTALSKYRIEGSWTADSTYDGKKITASADCAPSLFFLEKKTEIKAAPIVIAEAAPAAHLIKPVIKPWDGYYQKTTIPTSRVTPYAPMREADVVFAKRIWEEIDLREKNNSYMASPKSRLIDVLMDAIMAGELTAYDPNSTTQDPGGDGFYKPLKAEEAKGRLSDSGLVQKRDANNNIISSIMTANNFNPDSVIRFRIKEDYYFDKQQSVYEPRIIGIAPLFKPKTAVGAADYIPAFWIYFPDARAVLATKEVANRYNDAARLSYDDVFMKRMFTGYVIKQTNNKDERIRDYADGIDRLYESQRIKKALMDWELDLWQY